MSLRYAHLARFYSPRPARFRLALLLSLLSACASGSSGQDSSGLMGDGDEDSAGRSGAAGGDGFGNADSTQAPTPSCSPDCQDFPAAVLLHDGVTEADAARFDDSGDFEGPGACILEPALSDGQRPGALFPSNWLRPRIRFEPPAGETLWEIRMQSPREQHTLRAVMRSTTWVMPADIWEGLARNSADVEITVTLRGLADGESTPSGVRGSFVIAPVEARGTLVYWATTSSEVVPDASKLAGFAVGDEGVVDALTVPGVGDRAIKNEGGRSLRTGKGVPDGHVQCIGCHVSTPDGEAVAFTDHWPWNNVLAGIEETTMGMRPPYLTPGAEVLLNQPWLGMQTFSPAHWEPGERIVVAAISPRSTPSGVGYSDGAMYPSRADRLVFIDLETAASFPSDPTQGDVQQQLNDGIGAELGGSLGLLALDGETRSVAAPDWSHDGSRIVYTSADFTQDGRLSQNNSEIDLHVVPYDMGRGGAVQPVAGASQPGVAEYYPAFSADDALIAFTRVDRIDSAPMYYRPEGEVWVVPSQGGEALRLLANDPPACSGESSPGVINSWPKWSPSVARVAASGEEFGTAARSFYFLIFSSARAYPGQFTLPRTQFSPPDTRSSQLYMTALVLDHGSNTLQSFPAVYLWNQEPDTSNLTPAWDELKLPPVIPPE